MVISELKQKLRQLKKLETQIRFQNQKSEQHKQYVWSKYFSTKDENNSCVKYNMKKLIKMNHDELKEVFNEYFYQVYFQYYRENAIAVGEMYDVELLERLGLPPNSSKDAIKSKFRELAKIYHPDLGGESNKFIELIDIY